MTEIPEYLLKRSKDRRAGEASGESSGDAGAASVSKAVEAAPNVAAAIVAQAAPVVKAEPAYIVAAKTRTRIPMWAMPVVALLPLWGFIYAATLDAKPAGATGPIAEGATLFRTNCAGCHGAEGGGGTGRKLSEGEVNKTFLNADEQTAFVLSGSKVFDGKPYGNPDREGGPHIGGSYSKGQYMPKFEGQLTKEQVSAIVCYERIEWYGTAKPDDKLAPSVDYLAECSGKAPAGDAGAATTTTKKP